VTDRRARMARSLEGSPSSALATDQRRDWDDFTLRCLDATLTGPAATAEDFCGLFPNLAPDPKKVSVFRSDDDQTDAPTAPPQTTTALVLVCDLTVPTTQGRTEEGPPFDDLESEELPEVEQAPILGGPAPAPLRVDAFGDQAGYIPSAGARRTNPRRPSHALPLPAPPDVGSPVDAGGPSADPAPPPHTAESDDLSEGPAPPPGRSVFNPGIRPVPPSSSLEDMPLPAAPLSLSPSGGLSGPLPLPPCPPSAPLCPALRLPAAVVDLTVSPASTGSRIIYDELLTGSESGVPMSWHDAVEPFMLDAGFDYDGVTLTPKPRHPIP